MFVALKVLALIGRAIVPLLDAESVLQIFGPLPVVARPVSSSVDSKTVRLVVLPLSLVDISVGVDESSSAVGLVIDPKSLIKCVVLPYLFSLAVAHAVAELADIPGAILHLNWAFGDMRRQVIVIAFEWSKLDCYFSSGVVIEVLRLQAVVLLRIQHKRIFALVLNSLACLTLIPHFTFE